MAAEDDTYQTPQLLMRAAAPPSRKPAASHSVTFVASSRPSPDSTLEPSYHDQRTSSSGSRETHSSGTG